MNSIFGFQNSLSRATILLSLLVSLGLMLQLFGGAFFVPSTAHAQVDEADSSSPEQSSSVQTIADPVTPASPADEPAMDQSGSEETVNSLDVLSEVFVDVTSESSVSAESEQLTSFALSFSSERTSGDHDDSNCSDKHERVTLKDLPVSANACVVGQDTGGISVGSGEMLWHFVLTNSKTDHPAILHASFGAETFEVPPSSVNDGVQHFFVKTASGAVLTDAFVTGAVAKHGKKLSLQLSHCAFGSDTPPPPPMATIVATKIVCDSESDLPNWGAGGPDITANTAAQFLATHPSCRPASGWKFQSAPAGTANPGDDFIGEASAPWTTSPATDSTGKATWSIPAQGERVWVREVLRDGYIPFTYGANSGTNADSVSAEMYCHTDVLNYDNYDAITSLRGGATYYCIAFNAPKPHVDPSACPFTAGEGSYVIQFGTGKKIVSNSTHSAASVTKSVSIPAGVYEVSLYSYDSYPSRSGVLQPREEWYLRLSDTSGLVATSGAIGDLPDNVVTATRNEYVGDVTLSRAVTSAMAKHAAWPDTSSANSLYPICAQLRLKETPNLPPVITVNLPNPQTVYQGDMFVDLGATAMDPEDGDITSQISASGSVDTSVLGTYTITYTVVDSQGLPAEPKTRTVMVVERPEVCAEPSTSGDTTVNTPKVSGEKTVREIMEEHGIFIDPSVSGREYQTWALSKDVTDIEVTYLGGVAGSKRAFGFYRDSDKSGFVGIFKANAHSAYPSLPTFTAGDKATVSVARGMTGKLGFAIDVELSGRKVYTTENALNHDTADHVLVYEIAQGDYVLAFEDVAIPGADEDFNDLVVRVKVTGCRDVTVFSQCSDDVDNDGDGKVDYPSDLGCESATDDDENDRPVITVLPPNPMIVAIGTTFTDPGATASDAEDGDITTSIVSSGSVDTSNVGTYTITYTVSDSQGLAAEPKTRTVIVVSQCSDGVDNDGDGKIDSVDTGCSNPNDDDENTPPVITLIGVNPMDVIQGTIFTDPGATANDVEDGAFAATPAGSVDTSTLGVYVITYTAVDSHGAAAEPVTRMVNVVPSVPTSQCSDDVDNDGDGKVDYPSDLGCESATDDDENDRPVITVLPPNPMIVAIGTTFTDPGATASDAEDGDITTSIVSSGSVDTSNVGTYTITYTVSDSQGLAAEPKTRTVIVVSQCSDGVDNDGDTLVDYPEDVGCESPNDDTENARPVITVLGDNPVTIVVGTVFVDPGATASDLEDGAIPVTSEGTVDVGTVGTYTITYTAQDSQGLSAEPKTRTVNVIPSSGCTINCGGGSTPPECSNGGDDDGDGLADYPADPGCSSSSDDDERDGGPTLTLLGGNPLTITQGAAFTDPGATAWDPEDGDITSRIFVSGTVNTAVLGAYTLTYNVSDTSGNAATPVTRTVNVVSGGGGGGGSTALIITNEKIEQTGIPGEARITWNTNLAATSRVVYGVASVAAPAEAPLYGYATTNATDTTLVYNHSMTVTGLVEGVTYYFRPVSTDGAQTAVGIELVLNQGAPTSCHYLREYLRYGMPNNPEEVVKLQSFLRDFEGFSEIEVTGFFDLTTDAAVRAFQDKYAADILVPWNLPGNTGYVYYTTQKKINEIYCQRAFPLNDAQLAEIEAYKRLLASLEQGATTGTPQPMPIVGSADETSGRAAGDVDTNRGEVAGVATEETKMTSVGDDAGPGALERGRIALADLLATVPNLGEKLRGTKSDGTATDSLAENEAFEGEANDSATSSRFAAAVGTMKNISGYVWLAWALFLIILLLIVLYARLWIRHRSEIDEQPGSSTSTK